MTIYELLDEKREAIKNVSAKYGAHNVRVFGSVARREAGPESDIDLLVSFDKGVSLLTHAALMLELQKLLGCKVDVASDRGLRPRVKTRVLSEARPV